MNEVNTITIVITCADGSKETQIIDGLNEPKEIVLNWVDTIDEYFVSEYWRRNRS